MTVLIAAMAAMSGLLIGYSTAVIAPVLELITRQFGLDPVMQGVVVSSVLFGGLVGSLAAGGLIRQLGERPVMIGTALLFVIGPIGSALGQLGHLNAGLAHGPGARRRRRDHGDAALCQRDSAGAPARRTGIGRSSSPSPSASCCPMSRAPHGPRPAGGRRCWASACVPAVLMLLGRTGGAGKPALAAAAWPARGRRRRITASTGGHGEALPTLVEREPQGDWRDLFTAAQSPGADPRRRAVRLRQSQRD